jgi:hypothetical protein
MGTGNMKTRERLPAWLIIGMVMIWVLWAADVVFQTIQYQRITLFSILFFIALLAGYILPGIFKWPLYNGQPSRPAIISLLILIIILIGYILIRTQVIL